MDGAGIGKLSTAVLVLLCLVDPSGGECGFDCQGDIEESFLNVTLLHHISLDVEETLPPRQGRRGEVRFHLYTRFGGKRAEIFSFPPTKTEEPPLANFNRSLPTKVLIHGWMATVPSLITELFRRAYQKTGDYNLVMADWSESGSLDLYPLARWGVPHVAGQVAAFLDLIAARYGQRLEDIHLIGHSLGAHIAGVAGRLVRSGKIGRITGLDPAGPLIDWSTEEGRLSPGSGHLVDVIHTCGGYLGTTRPLGHVDFYPNGGTAIQPGCGLDLLGRCSHRRSYAYYTESIRTKKAFPAQSCGSWYDFKARRCRRDSASGSRQLLYMGEPLTAAGARGNYFLRTNRKEPFGRSTPGAKK